MNLLRSLLFTPGNNERMIAKAAARGADVVILDLEDAVPISEKAAARTMVGSSVGGVAAHGVPVFVRVNALSTGLAEDDLKGVVQPGLGGIVVPKVESGAHLALVSEHLTALEGERGLATGAICLIPLLETARGILNAWAIATASERVVAVAFGALDLARDLGATPSAAGTEVLYARSHVVLVAAAAKVQAVDSPWIVIEDRDGLIQDAQRARLMGYDGKLVVHPGQIEHVNTVFSPSQEEIDAARRTLEAFRAAEQRGLGAISLGGVMVDAANARQAADLVARAEAIAQRSGGGATSQQRSE